MRCIKVLLHQIYGQIPNHLEGLLGLILQIVIKNIAIQGEFGTLMKNWNYKSLKILSKSIKFFHSI